MTQSCKYMVRNNQHPPSMDFKDGAGNGGGLLKKLSKYEKRALKIFLSFFQGFLELIEVLFN